MQLSAPPQTQPNSASASAMKQPQQVLLAINPKAGAGDKEHLLGEVVRQLAEAGYVAHRITDIEKLKREATRLLESQDLRAVIIAGGDGSARLVAEALPANTPLVMMPMGTENLLAKHLGYRPNVQSVVQAVTKGVPLLMDGGLANGRLFLVMVGIGFDAEVVHRLHTRRTGNISRWSYLFPILGAVWNYRYPKMELEMEGETVISPCSQETSPKTAFFVFVSNLPKYAGLLSFSPSAKENDGLLDVVAFCQKGFWKGVWYVLSVWMGRHHAMQDVHVSTTQKINITTTASHPVQFQIDGDPGGVLPLQIEVVPARLTFLVCPAR